MGIESELDQMFPSPEEVPQEVLLPGRLDQTGYLVGGEIRTWDGPRQEVFSPVCLRRDGTLHQEPIGSYPLQTEAEAIEALEAASRAWDRGRGLWPTMSVADRIRHVEDFVFRMTGSRDRIVRLIMWEIGKTAKDAAKEFDRTVDYIRDTIDALKQLDRVSSRFEIREGVIGQIRHSPLGIVLSMGPYNYPLNETFTTLIPALIMGNVAIFKPPRYGVLLHEPLLFAFRDSFPPGVVNTVYGRGQAVVGPLMRTGRIDVLALIGGASAANRLEKEHPRPNRLKRVLGLEAKNAGIVLPDADLDLAVRECVTGSLSFNGQRCTALKLLHVHRSVLDEFLDKFTAAVGALKFGVPWKDGVLLTPLPEAGKCQWLDGLVADAKEHGARVLNEMGGSIRATYFHPAIVYPANEKMQLWTVEQFGPVIPIAPFDELEPVIESIEVADVGQQVSVFGRDPDQMARLIDRMVNQVCRVNLNSQCQRGPDTFPFTGRKDSAEGTLSVSDALRVFAIRALVAAKEGPENKQLITEIVRDHRSKFLSTDFIL